MPIKYLALDVGQVRIGLATGNDVASIASVLTTVPNDENLITTLQEVVIVESIDELVVGLPRGLNGQDTNQTDYIHDFVSQLKTVFDKPIHLQDEALTSVKAEQELESRGKPYQKGDIDALSAVYILEDYFKEGVH